VDGQPEPDVDLPAVHRRRPAALQLPRDHKLSTNGAAACGGYYIRHYGYTLRLDPITTTTGRGDATFRATN
jgi:hypothetical protein